MGISMNSKERYGMSLNTRLSDNFSETWTVKAPLDPVEGLIVPEM